MNTPDMDADEVIHALERRLAAAEADRSELLEQIEEWQDASGLCSPAEENGGDPGGVKPKHLARHVTALTEERDAARAELSQLRAWAANEPCENYSDGVCDALTPVAWCVPCTARAALASDAPEAK